MAGKIFINYRRDDSPGTAGRLHDRLAQAFGRNNLFMDVDHIPAGVDFTEYLHSQVAACDVFLVVIGPNWLDAKDDDGRRRFDNPDDFVTIEIAGALARKIRVIPVLVDGARTPKADKLPDSIKPLVRRNAVEVRNTQFGRDAEMLTNKVREALTVARSATGPWPFMASAAARLIVAGSAIALLLVGWLGLYQMGMPVWVPWTPRAGQPDAPGADRAKAAADAEAQRKATEAEQQRLAAAKAEEERKAKTAADAEAQRKAEEAEQQRLAAAKAEEERKQAEAEVRARTSALVREGITDINNRDYDRAIAALSEAKRLNPRSAPIFTDLGTAYMRKGDTDGAISEYNEAIRVDPTYGFAFHQMGVAFARKGDIDRAIAYYDEAIRLDYKHAIAFLNRGRAYMTKGDNDRAIADFTQAIQLDPKNAPTFNNQGSGQGLNPAIPEASQTVLAFLNRGIAYMNKGDAGRAIPDFDEVIQLDPKSALAFCNRGKLKLRINDASGNADIAKAKELGASICR